MAPLGRVIVVGFPWVSRLMVVVRLSASVWVVTLRLASNSKVVVRWLASVKEAAFTGAANGAGLLCVPWPAAWFGTASRWLGGGQLPRLARRQRGLLEAARVVVLVLRRLPARVCPLRQAALRVVGERLLGRVRKGHAREVAVAVMREGRDAPRRIGNGGQPIAAIGEGRHLAGGIGDRAETVLGIIGIGGLIVVPVRDGGLEALGGELILRAFFHRARAIVKVKT